MLPPEGEALKLIEGLLEHWLEEPPVKFPGPRRSGGDRGPDLLATWGKATLAIEYKAARDSAGIGSAIAQAKLYAAALGPRAIPVVAVPYMGDLGRRLCEQAGVSWLDLSGNAHLVGPGFRIIIVGRPNQFVRRGRPSTVFAPRSSRIARHLLLEPTRAFRQQELARETGLDDGFTSRIVRKLEADELVVRNPEGAIRPRDPGLLLDAWAEVYQFEKHRILRGHVPARSSEELLDRLAKELSRAGLSHAATGLGAAWLRTEFAGFRLVTFFLRERPPDELLRRLDFHDEPRGANVWLVIPNDDDVFAGAEDVRGVRCVHPVQGYLDLLAHPERAKEAAEELRTRFLRWKS